jgi:hypothetical protein
MAKPELSLMQEVILMGGVVADYGLKLKSRQDWSVSPTRRLQFNLSAPLIRIAKQLPTFIRTPLKRMVRWAIKI